MNGLYDCVKSTATESQKSSRQTTALGKVILVAQWGMKDKKLLAAARNRVGQVQTLSLEPLSDKDELESVMRNDDTNEFELEPYFAK